MASAAPHLAFANRLAVVTGSTSGIGRAIALRLSRAGASVVVNGRSAVTTEEAARSMATEVGTSGKFIPIAADVSTAAGVVQLAARVHELQQPVDILVNNTGVFATKDFFQTTDDEWRTFLDYNLLSSVRLSKIFLKGMLERKRGRIINIASEAAFKPLPTMLAYSVSKTALVSLSRGLAELTRGTGVTVNAVLAGPTDAGGVRQLFEEQAVQEGRDVQTVIRNHFRVHEPTSLLQRLITVDEVAATVAFLASDEAAAINGHAQRVDGGMIQHL